MSEPDGALEASTEEVWRRQNEFYLNKPGAVTAMVRLRHYDVEKELPGPGTGRCGIIIAEDKITVDPIDGSVGSNGGFWIEVTAEGAWRVIVNSGDGRQTAMVTIKDGGLTVSEQEG